MLRLVFVRHAQCEMNLTVDKHIGGRSDASPLTPSGRMQAAAVGAHLARFLAERGVDPAACTWHSSTAVRAKETALAVLQAVQLAPAVLQLSESLLELEQGGWEGKLRSDCYSQELLASFAADPWGKAWTFAPPGGESQQQVEERMAAYVTEVVLPGASASAPAFIFGHGMAIKCLLRHILSSLPTMSRNIALYNTAVIELGYVPPPAPGKNGDAGRKNGASSGGGGSSGTAAGGIGGGGGGAWRVLRLNDASHLPPDLLT